MTKIARFAIPLALLGTQFASCSVMYSDFQNYAVGQCERFIDMMERKRCRTANSATQQAYEQERLKSRGQLPASAPNASSPTAASRATSAT